MLSNCASEANNNEAEIELTLADLQGQWTQVDVDTIIEKQSIKQVELRPAVEYYRPEFELVDGVIQCVNCDEFDFLPYMPERTIEFSGDTIYEFELPIRMRSNEQVKLEDNILKFVHGGGHWNGVWLESIGDIHIELSKDFNTLFISYLEETGLYLKETYQRDHFEDSLISILKNYRENLPEASGKYSLVHYYFESVDYDTPFEHYHSFPHAIPETLSLSKQELLSVLKNNRIIELPTDGEMKAYELSWGWGDNITLQPENYIYHPDSTWYQGPDTSMYIWYRRFE